MKNVNAELTDATWYMSAVIEVTLRLAAGTDGSGAEEIGSKTFVNRDSGIISWAKGLKTKDPAMNWSNNTLENVLPRLYNMMFSMPETAVYQKIVFYDVDSRLRVKEGYLTKKDKDVYIIGDKSGACYDIITMEI